MPKCTSKLVRRRDMPFETLLGFYQIKKALSIKRSVFSTKNPSVLDVGCGIGELTKILCDHFDDVTGVDPLAEAIEESRKNVPNARFFCSKIEDFKSKSNQKFGYIFLFNVLEESDDSVETLKKVRRLLADDGYVHIQVPNANSLHRLLGVKIKLIKQADALSQVDINAMHKRVYTLELLSKHIALAGLHKIEGGSFFLKVFSNEQMQMLLESEIWHPKLGDALYKLGQELNLGAILYATATRG